MRDIVDADFTEFKPNEHLEALRQEHEGFLTQLEALAVMAIASNDWSQVRDLINDFKVYHHLDADCGVQRLDTGRSRGTTQVDFAKHTGIRAPIRETLEAFRSEGISNSELIECISNELHLLKLQDQQEFEASTKDLSRPGADSLPPTNKTID
jgi:hypothetical protein